MCMILFVDIWPRTADRGGKKMFDGNLLWKLKSNCENNVGLRVLEIDRGALHVQTVAKSPKPCEKVSP